MKFPTNAPRTSNGKNIPPGEPEPKHIKVNKNFTTININKNNNVNCPSFKDIINSCPPPKTIGNINANIPVIIKGIIHFTSTDIFNFLYKSCVFKSPLLNITPLVPIIIPSIISPQ